MGDRAAPRAEWGYAAAGRVALLGVAVAGWLSGFALLDRLGTWTPVAVVGPALAALAIGLDGATRALLRPSLRLAAIGLVAGLLMVALTHAAFAGLAALVPEVRAATVRLYALLNVEGFSVAARAGLVVIVASSEEVLFRGAVMDPAAPPGARPRGAGGPAAALRVVVLAAVYAAAMATLGSALLVACAFGCAVLWGALRAGTRSLVPPLVAHVIWDLGVLVAVPLVRPGG